MKFNTSSLLLSLLIFSPVIAGQNSAQTEPSELGKWSNLSLYYLKQLPPLAISATIGAVTGGLCGVFCADIDIFSKDDSSRAVLISGIALVAWLTEMYTRSALVNEFQKDLDRQKIDHKKRLMSTTAWLSSWVAFFAALDAKGKSLTA